MRRPWLAVTIILVVILIALVVVFVEVLQHPAGPTANGTPTPGTGLTPTSTLSTTPTGALHVEGTQIVDASGQAVVLRGAETDSSFIYMKGWQSGKRPADTLTSAVYNTMASDWRMNVIRIPVSNWIYAAYSGEFLSQLDTVVQRANAAGLYVVLALHDDANAGSPYGKNATLPKTEDITFWKAVAGHYRDNARVMFDLYNEPKDPSWQVWLHGGITMGGATAVGFQDMVNAIRSVGAQQIIVVEPGSAGKGANAGGVNAAEEGGWTTFGNNTIKDANIVYSLHDYDGIALPPARLDMKWGPILHHHPLYYGEWGLIADVSGAAGLAHCRSIAHDQADSIVTNFLGYMASRGASWTAWQFAPHLLVKNYTTFTPTSLNIPWTCGDPTSDAGMGELVKNYLTGH